MLRGIKAGTAHGEARLDGEEEMLRQGSFENDGVHGVSRVISPEVVERMMEDVYGWPEVVKGRKLVIVDGFLLFGKSIPDSLRGLFDVRVLLRAKYEDAKRRRERRNGYVTLEGFWQDPEGYFDGVVWPGYVREYGGMVGGGDGDELVGEGGSGGGQRVWFSEPEWGLERCLEWVVGVVRREIEDLDRGGDE